MQLWLQLREAIEDLLAILWQNEKISEVSMEGTEV
jgi:hypothetical protein